jgi:hypothetical protein
MIHEVGSWPRTCSCCCRSASMASAGMACLHGHALHIAGTCLLLQLVWPVCRRKACCGCLKVLQEPGRSYTLLPAGVLTHPARTQHALVELQAPVQVTADQGDMVHPLERHRSCKQPRIRVRSGVQVYRRRGATPPTAAGMCRARTRHLSWAGGAAGLIRLRGSHQGR